MKKLSYFILSALIILMASCKADEAIYDTAAKAAFTTVSNLYELGESVAFTDVSVPQNGTTIVSWKWQFGDVEKTTSTEQNPSFIYKSANTYTVELTVIDSNGLKSSSTKDITVFDPSKLINVLWQKKLGGVINAGVSPVLSADGAAVYMYANAMTNEIPALIAYDIETGNTRWSFDINQAMKENHDGGSAVAGASDIFCSPSVGTNGDVYFSIRDLKDSGANRRLFTFAVKSTGKLSWIDVAPDANIYGITPAIDAAGNVYVGNRGKKLHVFSNTGSLLKTIVLGNELISGLSLSKAGNIYFGSNPTSLFSYNYASGAQIFSTLLGGGGLKANSYTIDTDGTIYAATAIDGGSGIVAIKPDGTKKWSYSSPGEIADGGVVIAADGTLYATGGKVVEGKVSGGIIALNSDGTLKWHYGTTDDVSSCVPLIDNRGYIHFFSNTAVYYIVKPDGTLLASSKLGVKTLSSPVMDAKGNLFVGIEIEAGVSQMFSISSNAKSYANSAWPMKGQNPQRTSLQK